MVRLFSFILAAFIFSCTIIEDSDITSQEELDELKLKSIEIEQQAQTGAQTSVANVTSDNQVSISVPGGVIKRTIWMNWPALGANSKLKVKSGTTSAFRSYTSLLESGKPWTFYLFSNGTDSTILELYSFRYDANGRLTNIITRAPYVAGGPATSNDTLIYGNVGNTSEVTSIIRRSQDASKTGTFVINQGSIFSNGWAFDFQGTRYFKTCQGSGCGENYGGAYHSRATNGNQPYGVVDITDLQRAYITVQDKNHDLSQYSCGTCPRYSDTFYLHPLMLLNNQIPFHAPQNNSGGFDELGDALLFMYMVDWWRPVTTLQTGNTEKVTFNFRYDQ